MAVHVGLGTSENEDAFLAGRLAAQAAIQQAKSSTLELFLVFSSAKFDQLRVLQGIQNSVGKATVIGCSTAGEISTAGSTKNSVAVLGLNARALGLNFATGLGFGVSHDPRGAGQKCAQEAAKSRLPKRQVFLMFPDGLARNGSEVIRGAQEVLGTSFPIVGGSAGDDFLFRKTYQYLNQKVFSDSIAGILLGGNVSVGVGIRHGWHPIGKAHTVTASRGNVIGAIDGRSAFSIYRDYFDEEAENLKRLSWAKVGTIYPLGVSIPEEEEYLIRYAFKATSSGELVCAAEVPQDAQVRLMITDKQGVLNAAREATLRAKENLAGANIFAVIIFDSIARKRVLGISAKEEIAVIRRTLGRPVPIIGFYSYGEQAPLRSEKFIGKSYFHNETIVVLCLAQAKT
ncbi:FIST signal transduction protein [Candidatus Omnitrophota bacterium]